MNQSVVHIFSFTARSLIMTACGANAVVPTAASESGAVPEVAVTAPAPTAVVDEDLSETVLTTTACLAFVDNTTIHCEADTAFVESDGLPATHNMMVGIASWQQQVPLPQAFDLEMPV